MLGRNVWPGTGLSPFLNGLPNDWDELFTLWQEPVRRSCRDHYAWRLIEAQWTFDQVRHAGRVGRLLASLSDDAPSERVREWLGLAPSIGHRDAPPSFDPAQGRPLHSIDLRPSSGGAGARSIV